MSINKNWSFYHRNFLKNAILINDLLIVLAAEKKSLNQKVHCPFCMTEDLELVDVDPDKKVRKYTDSAKSS